VRQVFIHICTQGAIKRPWQTNKRDALMLCPHCGSDDLKVLDTTDTKQGIRRRRECNNCGKRFSTFESLLSITPMLIKSDGRREAFDVDKLKRSIWSACAKRPIPAAAVDRLTSHIETHLHETGRAEVPSRVVGDMVIAGLKQIDAVAYIRYVIVYMGLDNLLSVRQEIDKLLAEQHGLEQAPKARRQRGKRKRSTLSAKALADVAAAMNQAMNPANVKDQPLVLNTVERMSEITSNSPELAGGVAAVAEPKQRKKAPKNQRRGTKIPAVS
jgi:transcriptional repressor NrdR